MSPLVDEFGPLARAALVVSGITESTAAYARARRGARGLARPVKPKNQRKKPGS
jgi:hypothetical protein